MIASPSSSFHKWYPVFSLIVFTLVAALPGHAAPTIPNPSFEADTFTVNEGSVADNGPITGWTATGTSNLGLNPVSGSNPFADNGAVPDGNQVAYLGSVSNIKAALATTITGLTVGETYVVRFRANRRAAFSNPGTLLTLNGDAPVFFSVSPAVDSFGVHVSPYYRFAGAFTATATTAALEISNETSSDSALLVDAFSIAVAAYEVTTIADSGPGSLRYVLEDAAAVPGANTITFAPALSGQTITLADEIVVEDTDGVAVDASALTDGITIDGGAGTNRLFDVSGPYAGATAQMTLHRVTLTGGNGTGANSFRNGHGGAIVINSALVTLDRCTLHGNSVSGRGGAILVSGNSSVVTLTRCSLFDNSAEENGGAISAGFGGGSPNVMLSQCTLFDNAATGSSDGGAISNTGTMTLTHCTVAENYADNAGGGIQNSFGTLTLEYSIIAGNTTSSPSSTSKDARFSSGNLILNGTSFVPSLENTATTSGSGAISTADPLLDTLADNSGPTQTVALLAGSPAIDAATGSTVTTDQRGLSVVGTPDTGAFEVLSSDSSLTSLLLSGVTLIPAFDSGTTDYTASVDFATTSVTITPTAAETLAAITVNGTTVNSGSTSASLPLMVGDTVLTTVVTAPNGFTSTPYTVTISRLPSNTDGDGNGFTDLEEYYLAALPSAFAVGDEVSIDLGAILFPLPAGQSLLVTGLPRGLKFDRVTGLITGTVLAELGDPLVRIVIRQGKTTLGSIDLDFSVAPYEFVGQFEALIEDGSGLPVGKANLLITRPGAFSATLELQGQRRRSARGTFTNPPSGDEQTVTVAFPAIGAIFPATTVELVISSASDLVSGTQETNTLRGFRLAKSGRAPTQRVTVAFENDVAGDRTTTPGGTGYATGSANSRGLLPLRGLLGDAQRFSTPLLLSQTSQAVVFVQPYPDKTISFFGGIITVGDLGQPERGGSAESETAGLQWRKIAKPTDRSYPLGIGVPSPLAVTGNVSNWEPLPTAEALALSLGLDFREIFADYTAPPTGILPQGLSLHNNYSLVTLTPTDAVRWSGRANARSGTFAGRMKLPTPAANTPVTGVLLQDQSFGSKVGVGIVRIPTTTAVRGSFETSGIHFLQETPDVISTASFTVTTGLDSGAGSLRQAIIDAASAAGPDVIDFAPALSGQSITLSSEIIVADSGGVEIDATALAGGLTIDGGPGTNRIFQIGSNSSLTLRGLTLTGGNGTGATESGRGGAIKNLFGTLIMTQCTLSDNSASDRGGAIDNSGQAALTQCTFSGNTATTNDGGAIFSFGGSTTMTLTHCTISDNFAGNAGGGVESSSGTLTLNYCIIAGNLTPFAGDKDLRNNGSLVLNGTSLIPIYSNGGSTGGSGNISTADPLLDTLASNGGGTPTFALMSGSPAIDAAVGSTVTTDQRGFPVSGTPDTGAFEDQLSGGSGAFTNVQKDNLRSLPWSYEVGDVVNIDLGAIMFPLPAGQSLLVTGLPRGLRFDRVTGLITGTILAELGAAPVQVVVRQGPRPLGSLVLKFFVAPYEFVGQFEALIEDLSGLSVGKAKLLITRPGIFSATLELQGQRRRATRGSFTNPPSANEQTVTVAFPAIGAIFPATTVEFLISSASDLVSGTQDTNNLRGFRLAKPGRAPTQQVTVAFETDGSPDRTTSPAGIGYATGSANSRGLLPLRGLLGDGQVFSTLLLHSQTNQAVIFIQPYPDKTVSFFGGIIMIGDLGHPERGGSTESEAAGLQWRKIAKATDRSYPLGIGVATPFAVTGSVSNWVRPPSSEGLALSLGLDSREIFVNYTAPPAGVLPDRLSLRNSYSLVRLTPTDAVPWRVRANARSGTFAGRMTLPAPAANTVVTGVLLQDQVFGTTVGAGIIRIPTATAVRGSFETDGIRLSNELIP